MANSARLRPPFSTRKTPLKADFLAQNRARRAQLASEGSGGPDRAKTAPFDALPEHLHPAALDVFEALLDAWPEPQPPLAPCFFLAESEHAEARAIATARFGDRAWSLAEISYAFRRRDLLAEREAA